MTIVDHLFVFLLFVVQPIYSAHSYKKHLRLIETGAQPGRLTMYRETSRIQWLALLVLILAWYWLDRPFSALGLRPLQGQGFYIGLALVLSLCGFLLITWKRAKTMSVEDKKRQEKSFGKLVHFLPRTADHLKGFIRLSVTAGIVEEILYRGFVIWYLSLVVPLWAAVFISSVLFGLGHSYQGPAGALKTGLVGLAFAGLYVLSGSIWLPIIGHVLLDALQGLMILEILRSDKQATTTASAA